MSGKIKINFFIKLKTIFLISLFGGLYGQTGGQDIDSENVSLSWGLFIESQLYAENHGVSNIYSETHDDGFRLRRARLNFLAEGKNFNAAMQANGAREQIIEEAYGDFAVLPFAYVRFGRFARPFGYELYQPAQNLLFAERSRFWSYLFYDKRGHGISFDLHSSGKRVMWQNGFFYNYTDGYTTIRQQEVSSRLIYESERYLAGLSGYYNIRKFEGDALPSYLKSSLFAGVKFGGLRMNVEGVLRQNADEADLRDMGASYSINYLFSGDLSFDFRLAWLSLSDPENTTGREIGDDKYITSIDTPAESVDLTLGFSYIFFKTTYDDGKEGEGKLMINYQPSIHRETGKTFDDKIVGQSWYLMTQFQF